MPTVLVRLDLLSTARRSVLSSRVRRQALTDEPPAATGTANETRFLNGAAVSTCW
jgi:hypothetical protein